jgi:hypothetical protein
VNGINLTDFYWLKKYFVISFFPIVIFLSYFGSGEILNANVFTDFQLAHYTDETVEEEVECKDSVLHYSILNDRIHDYIRDSYKNGIGILTKTHTINSLIKNAKLVELKSNSFYIVDTMFYSYPFLIPSAVKLLDEIGLAFQKKMVNTKMQDARFIITSALRTNQSVKRLRKRNANATKFSAHLHGTAFDIAYDEFLSNDQPTFAEINCLKDILAETLIEFKLNEKCWVTYEVNQACFHIVVK